MAVDPEYGCALCFVLVCACSPKGTELNEQATRYRLCDSIWCDDVFSLIVSAINVLAYSMNVVSILNIVRIDPSLILLFNAAPVSS